MVDPLNEYALGEFALDFLNDDEGRLVKAMLKAVVEHGDIYDNGFSVSREGDHFVYHLANGNRPGPFQNRQKLPINITDRLIHHKIAGRKINPQWPESFRSFTPAALEWHRQYGGPGSDEVRKKIGQYLRTHWRPGEYQMIVPSTIAEATGLSFEAIREEIDVLIGIGLVKDEVMAIGQEYGSLVLTTPEGLRWALQGYPELRHWSTTTVNVQVDVNIGREIQEILREIRNASIPDALRDQYEARLRRVEDALEAPEGEGKYEVVRDLVETANHSRELLVPTINFLGKHLDKLQQLAEAVGQAF